MTAKTVLVFPFAENPFVTRMWLKGFTRYAKTCKWLIETVTCAAGKQLPCRKVQSLIRYHRAAGVVASCFDEIPRGALAGVPCVWMDPPMDRVPRSDSYVHHDGSAAAQLAAKELLRLGLTHFAAVGDLPERKWSKDRLAGFARNVRGKGTFEWMELATSTADKVANIRQIEPWLRRLPRPCGIFAVNDQIASAVVSAANRLGLRMPEDVAVVGVDNDEDICSMTTPSLTSIATDWEKGGFLAGEVLDFRLRNPSAPPVSRSFGELGIIRRASTTPGTLRVDSRVAEASVFIREHACEGIGVDDVVRRMGCSRRLAMMRYLEATGRSIFAEIREAQFEQALVLLSRRDIQLGAIADRCGWKSPTAFRTYFEKRLGMTLREWRNRNAAS